MINSTKVLSGKNSQELENSARQISKVQLKIKTSADFGDIVSKSPYSNQSEIERRLELEKNVEDAKAALKTFSYQQKSILLRLFEFMTLFR